MKLKLSVLSFLILFLNVKAGKILAIFPTPAFSHQVFFRPLMLELAKRGHEVTVLTPQPIGQKIQAPENYKEIIAQYSLSAWKNWTRPTGSNNDIYKDVRMITEITTNIFYHLLETEEVKEIIDDKSVQFDVIIVESWLRVTLGFAHRFKAPVIKFGSVGGVFDEFVITGSSIHPVLYTSPLAKKIQNFTIWEKILEFYSHYSILSMHRSLEDGENEMLKNYFGSDMPTLSDMTDRVHVIMLNVHRIWEMCRPNPLNLVAVGGIHIHPGEDLPKDLKSYLDSSVHGVIYVSFGCNSKITFLPPKQVEIMVEVLSRLPYDVIWKWNERTLPGSARNIRISKWFPQQDLLKHPKVKLFVTQGGLQSIDEAVAGGVPLLGIPSCLDQYYNVETIVRLNIGLHLPMQTFTKQDFEDRINTLIGHHRYRDNVVQLRSLLYDTPQSPLQRAVWWTEYVLRHGALHVRAPAHNMHWTEYLEIELLAAVFVSVISVTILLIVIIFKVVLFGRYYIQDRLNNTNSIYTNEN